MLHPDVCFFFTVDEVSNMLNLLHKNAMGIRDIKLGGFFFIVCLRPVLFAQLLDVWEAFLSDGLNLFPPDDGCSYGQRELIVDRNLKD